MNCKNFCELFCVTLLRQGAFPLENVLFFNAPQPNPNLTILCVFVFFVYLFTSWLSPNNSFFFLFKRFPFFSLKIRVFSKKKKKKGLQSESFSEETSATDSKLYVLFSRGTASFASPNIHHYSHGFHSAHTKKALRGNVAASNFHTAIIVRKAVSTTTFACFRGASDKVSRRTVWEPVL